LWSGSQQIGRAAFKVPNGVAGPRELLDASLHLMRAMIKVWAQLVSIRPVGSWVEGACHHRSTISSVSILTVASVTVPASAVQISPSSSTPLFTKLAVEGKTDGWFFRTNPAYVLQARLKK